MWTGRAGWGLPSDIKKNDLSIAKIAARSGVGFLRIGHWRLCLIILVELRLAGRSSR
jgi:hypothetical protein